MDDPSEKQFILSTTRTPQHDADIGPHITQRDKDWYRYMRQLMNRGCTLNTASLLAGDKFPGQGT
jgi:hypothetical protein